MTIFKALEAFLITLITFTLFYGGIYVGWRTHGVYPPRMFYANSIVAVFVMVLQGLIGVILCLNK